MSLTNEWNSTFPWSHGLGRFRDAPFSRHDQICWNNRYLRSPNVGPIVLFNVIFWAVKPMTVADGLQKL